MAMASHQLEDHHPIKTTVEPLLVAMATMVAMVAMIDVCKAGRLCENRDFKASEMLWHGIKQLLRLTKVTVVEDTDTAQAKTATTELVEVELDTTLRTTPTEATQSQQQAVEMEEVTEMLMVVTLTIFVAPPLQDVQLATTETSQVDELWRGLVKLVEEVEEGQEVVLQDARLRAEERVRETEDPEQSDCHRRCLWKVINFEQ